MTLHGRFGVAKSLAKYVKWLKNAKTYLTHLIEKDTYTYKGKTVLDTC